MAKVIKFQRIKNYVTGKILDEILSNYLLKDDLPISYKLTTNDLPLIQAGTDINTITDIGMYRCGNIATAGTLINSPTTTHGFKLSVEYVNATDSIVQTALYVENAVPVIAMRRGYYSSGNWSFGNWVTK